MRVKRLLIIGVALLFVLSIVAACGPSPEQAREPAKAGSEKVDKAPAGGGVVKTPPADGYVTITYGDGNLSVYERAFPLHSRYGFPGVNYVITSKAGAEGKMTVSQLKEMEAAGWETGSHSVSHKDFTTLDKEQIKEEVTASARWLEEQGLMHNSFSYPFGVARFDKFVKDTYSSAVLASGRSDINFAPVNPYELKRVLISKNTVDEVIGLLDRVKAEHGWLIVYTHNVYADAGEPDDYSINVSGLERFFKEIQSRNLEVVTVSEGVKLMTAKP